VKRDMLSLSVRQTLLAILCLGCIQQTSPWPGIQAVFHVCLVLGLAPLFQSPLVGGLWAVAAGWVLEGTLHTYPHMGGTAFANLNLCFAAHWALAQWPPRELKPFWGRLAILVIAHALLVHLMVRIAAGPHAWGLGWLWAFLFVPIWGTLSYRLYRPILRR
jgi:hypothetical protein